MKKIDGLKGLIYIIAILTFFLSGCEKGEEKVAGAAPAEKQPATTKTIVAVGNSLTEGLGVAEEDAYPARLQRKLNANGYAYRVVNAGISGETSSGALSRINWILTLKPDMVILETGANDGLRGVDPALTGENIDRIVRILRDRRVTVILAGMQMVGNLGKAFTTAFADIYPAVAKRHGLALIPFFLSGVAGDPELNQPDGIHPTAEGYRIVTETVYPYVVEAIAP